MHNKFELFWNLGKNCQVLYNANVRQAAFFRKFDGYV